MRCDEVDARPGPAAAVAENVGRSCDTRGQLRNEARIALPEATHRVAILAVPLGPARRKIPELIAIGAHVPRLRDQLQPGHRGILPDRVEERAVLPVRAVLAPKAR